jgi:hypothetical protein
LLLLASHSAVQNGDPALKGQAGIGVNHKGRLPVNLSRYLVALASLLFLTAAAAAAERIETIPTRPGVTQDLYVVQPTTAPWAAAILYVGGNGDIKLDSRRMPAGRVGNFLLRIRDQLLDAGILLVYPDVPSDLRGDGFGNFRNDARHVEDGGAIVKWIRANSAAPLFVIGTSRGTISAATLGGRLPPDTFAGVALTSSVTRQGARGQEAMDNAALARIAVPILVMHHRDDACNITPPADAPGILDKLKTSPRKDLVTIEGGLPAKSGPCDALTAHGYFGVEREAAQALIDWMKATIAAR